MITTTNRIAIITTTNRIAIFTTTNRITIITTTNRITIITITNRIAIITTTNRITIITTTKISVPWGILAQEGARGCYSNEGASEGGMIRLETLIELKFLNSSFSNSTLSVRAFRAYPLIEIRQAILY